MIGDKRHEHPAKIYCADLTYVHQGLQSEIMPNAIGCVAAFAKHRLGDRIEPTIYKRPLKLIDALHEEVPAVVAFSDYAWNHRIANAFAGAIKTKHPHVAIIFGGPNYPLDEARQIEFLRSHPHIDFFVVKEGEVAFASLVERLLEQDMDLNAYYDLPSVHYIDKRSGEPHLNPVGPRIRDLSEVPSPYLLGWMDEYFGDGFMPIIQTNRGCPFTCTFCVEGTSYYQKIYRSSAEKVASEIEYIAERMQPALVKGERADLFIADSNFGMYQQDIVTCKAIRGAQENYGWPQYISVATGKNQKERVLDAARLVQGAIRLSGSVQSLDPEVLANIKRANVDPDQLVALAFEGSDIGANTYSEVILGLPGDSLPKYKKTVSQLIEMGFNKVETYTLMLLHGSELDSQNTREQYQFVTKYRVIPRCFGHFDCLDTDISVGEIEEVVVATSTMPFEDYVVCRELALLVTLFYNDGVFEPAMRLLKSLKVPIMECIEAIHVQQWAGSDMAKIVREFSAETRNELWDSREKLSEFLGKRENMDRYISGEFGSNLLFKYKSLAMLTDMPVLVRTLSAAMKQVIAVHKPPLNAEQLQFIDELTAYCGARGQNIFKDFHQSYCLEVHYEFDDIIHNRLFPTLGGGVGSGAARQVEFYLDDTQRNTVQRIINTYGNHLTGLTRGLSRTNIKRLLRHQRINPAADTQSLSETYQ